MKYERVFSFLVGSFWSSSHGNMSGRGSGNKISVESRKVGGEILRYRDVKEIRIRSDESHFIWFVLVLNVY